MRLGTVGILGDLKEGLLRNEGMQLSTVANSLNSHFFNIKATI